MLNAWPKKNKKKTMDDSNKLAIQLTLQKGQCRKELLFLYFCISFQFEAATDLQENEI
jgi:putative sterol carrier protein